jgi:superfamily II DNA or RNA helicase
MVKIVLNNLTSKIIGYLPDSVHDQLDKSLSYRVKTAIYSPKYKNKQWDGRIRLYRRNYGQSFYSGLLSFVGEVLDENKIPYQKVDERIKPAQNLPHLTFTPPSNYEERDYQQFTIQRALQRSRGILKIATGGGKTMVVTELIASIKTAPFMFYVLTKDLMWQAHDVLSSALNEPIGVIGGGKCDIKNINVCTIQTAIQALHKGEKIKVSDYKFDDEDDWDEDDLLSLEKKEKIRELIYSLKGLYFDETHHAAAKTCKDVLSASPNAFWRFGGSATPYREDGAEILIQAMFGKKIVDVTASYLIDKGYLVQPAIIFEPIEQDCTYHAWKTVYKHCIIDNKDFNTHVANTAKHLMSKGLSVLILVNQYAQGDFIKTMLPDAPFVTGKKTDKQRDKSIEDLRNGNIKCMIATTLADEGLDIPTLDAVLMAGGGASATRVNQRIGRTLRKDKKATRQKKKALAIYYNHKGVRHLGDHAKKVRRILKTEPRFEVIESNGTGFIFSEIDLIMGANTQNTNTRTTLFDF